MRDCAKRLIAASGNRLTADDAKEIIKTVDRIAKRRAKEGFAYDESVKQVIDQRTKLVAENIAKQKAEMLENMIIKKKTTARIKEMIDSGIKLEKSFVAELEGISSNIEGTGDSLMTTKAAVESAYLSKVLKELNDDGLLELLNGKHLNDEIGKELWALSSGETGATKIKKAQDIAKIIYDAMESQRNRLNAAGADIAQLAGYVMPQRHDIAAMLKMGRDGYANFMAELLDPERSFGGDYDDLFNVLRGAYDAMVTGIRLTDPTEQGAKLFQFKGYANLAKRLSQSRQIIFKDYASWKKWNETLGTKDLSEGVFDAIRSNAGNIALMERYGTNPEAMLKAAARDIVSQYRGTLADKRSVGIQEKLDSIIDSALGKNDIATNPTLAQYGSMIRLFNEVTALGGALLSSLSDIPLKAAEYKFQGKGWLESQVQPFLDIGQGFKTKAEKTRWASMVGVGFESMIAGVWRFSPQDTLSGKASKMRRLYFKLNLQSWWTDTHRAAMGRVMTHELGLMKDLPFDKLGEDLQRLFGNYRITAEMWDKMRKGATRLEDGRDYITPDSVSDQAAKEALLKYITGRTSFGVLEADARVRRYSTLNTKRGTGAGEVMRLMMQFKSFPIAIITKVWGRTLYGKGKADVPAIAHLMLMTAVFGYMSGAAKDIAKGKTPKDPRKLETFYASMAQGGGFGIAGDLLFQEYSFGRSLGSVIAGPTVSKLDNFFRIFSEGARLGGSKRQSVMTVIGMIPFNNLFYTRAALDQLLLLDMQESMSPGYLQRMESNMKKTYGQKLLFK